jgi:hypothetical protein
MTQFSDMGAALKLSAFFRWERRRLAGNHYQRAAGTAAFPNTASEKHCVS